MAAPIRVLFVCLGNICRSPTAEGIFRAVVKARGVADRFEIDSAGTGAWHAGESPDPRMTRAAKKAGYRLAGAARAVHAEDYRHFDHILAMDAENLRTLVGRAPEAAQDKIRMFRDHDPDGRGEDVPDPYYGGPEGFDNVVQMVERTAEQLVDDLLEAARK